jgi:hypothetical protein
VNRRIHMSASIGGLLRKTDQQLDMIMSDENGPLSGSAARQKLEAMQAEGRTLIRACDESECPDFDEFGGGCPGHPIEAAA